MTALHRPEHDHRWIESAETVRLRDGSFGPIVRRVPDLTPDPYLSTGYRPGWAPPGVKATSVYPREDLVWLDRQWGLTDGPSVPDPERFGFRDWWWLIAIGVASVAWWTLCIALGWY